MQEQKTVQRENTRIWVNLLAMFEVLLTSFFQNLIFSKEWIDRVKSDKFLNKWNVHIIQIIDHFDN